MKPMQCLSPAQVDQMLSGEEAGIPFTEWEMHLENCEHCRRQLENAAGSADWWSDTAMLLSSVKMDQTTTSFVSPARAPFQAMDSTGAGQVPQQLTNSLIQQILQPGSHPEMLGRLGQYDVEAFLGQGGFGIVFKAHDSVLNRPVAIKVLAPHLATNGVARRRFEREAQAAAAVVHPNVVPIHAIHADEPYPFLVMSYIPGWTLQAYVQQFGPLDPKGVVRIAQQVAAGLAAAHRQGLIHRDIKPGNILLENGLNRALITDFGLARAADDAALSQTGWLTGTPHYMSPEQGAGEDLDQRSDLFSLGSVLYFMATGREPFRASQPLAVLQQIRHSQPLPICAINPEMPSLLSNTVRKLHQKRAADRWESASALANWLEGYLAHLQHPQTFLRPRLPVSPRNALSWLRKRTAAVSVAVALMFLLTGFGWWWNQQQFPSQEATIQPSPSAPSVDTVADGDSIAWESLESVEKIRRLELELLGRNLMSWQEWENEIQTLRTSIDQVDRPVEPIPIFPDIDSDSLQSHIDSVRQAIDAVERDIQW